MKILSFQDYEKRCQQPLRVPIYAEVSADLVSPIRVFYALKKKYKRGFLLESREQVEGTGRYSFIGFNPKITLEVKDQKTEVIYGEKRQKVSQDFHSVMRKILHDHKMVQSCELPPLAGGAVGFIGYDAIRVSENISSRHPDEDNLPDIYFGLYQTCIIFDHLHQVMTLVYIPDQKGTIKEQYQKGISHIQALMEQMASFHPTAEGWGSRSDLPLEFEVDSSDQDFEKIVQECGNYILAGDLYSVSLSRSFYKRVSADPIEIYRALRVLSPSPFMFYLDNEDYAIVGSSPERLVSLSQTQIETLPMGGSICRGRGEKDKENENKLLSDEKKMAEHIMRVDLARSSLGSVSLPGSVVVKDLKAIQRLSHVMHMISRVEGRIKPGLDALDVLKAFLPAVTLSGAPKIRAMEILDELEKSRRGVYGGCICYIDHLGNMDSCAMTQMALIKDGLAKVRVAAAVHFDSTLKKESLKEAQVILEAIAKAEEAIYDCAYR